ncbi:Ubiquinone/menaquinone biosynthesis C-methylase UbiE [Evansella caseinilytica]|uniref:Ubiquinone/menaquinone biosynthesis C-methylase UbiE n=1 Tax=Evansella caseinilytica TaxID=1503961 RepID=A0A1H3U0V5_9BACI|nr:class I SAM-dependent methyltransferase [Evansella caseinilytica]SDZ56100.1 Ubiquinone/menaquinone biosynthesis C-methylase UbiE [Evansella caseinilytica]
MRKNDVQLQFGKNAKAYVDSDIHRKGADLQQLVAITDMTGCEQALDIATGGGHTANAIAPHVREVVALDVTPQMLAEAEKFVRSQGNDNVRFVEGEAGELPFSAGAFDLVTCRIAAHHFPDVERFLAEVHRVLKDGGQFLLDDNTAPEVEAYDIFYNAVEKRRDYSHQRAYKKSEWVRMLERSGFCLLELHRFDKRFIFDNWCRRMNVTGKEKDSLNKLMLMTDEKLQRHFKLEVTENANGENTVVSFCGEAVLVKAIKK